MSNEEPEQKRDDPAVGCAVLPAAVAADGYRQTILYEQSLRAAFYSAVTPEDLERAEAIAARLDRERQERKVKRLRANARRDAKKKAAGA